MPMTPKKLTKKQQKAILASIRKAQEITKELEKLRKVDWRTMYIPFTI